MFCGDTVFTGLYGCKQNGCIVSQAAANSGFATRPVKMWASSLASSNFTCIWEYSLTIKPGCESYARVISTEKLRIGLHISIILSRKS